MGYGPVPAIQKALKCAGLTMADMDIIEVRGESGMCCSGLGHHRVDFCIKCLRAENPMSPSARNGFEFESELLLLNALEILISESDVQIDVGTASQHLAYEP